MPTKTQINRPLVLAAEPPKHMLFFPEGCGYFFLKTLATGAEGTAMLVRSARDGCVYVRTRKYATYHEGGTQLPIPEVQYHNHTSHRCIAMMLYSTTTVEDSCKRRLVSSYFPFYNMLDLLNLSKLRGDEDMPELLIWKMFEDMLSAVQYTHCKQNVSHGDISTSNIFVNLRLGEKFPEFFLGDFGVVAPLLKLGEKGYTVENEEVEGPQAQIQYDLQSLRDVIVTMAVGDAENGDAVGENYSRDLCDGISSLENLTASVESNHRGYVANIGKLQNQINHSARRCKPRNFDWSFLKADDPYADAETYNSVAAALNADSLPPGPFQVVKIDSKSWRILHKNHQIMFPLRCRPLESA